MWWQDLHGLGRVAADEADDNAEVHGGHGISAALP
jgi:hypothetical protein